VPNGVWSEEHLIKMEKHRGMKKAAKAKVRKTMREGEGEGERRSVPVAEQWEAFLNAFFLFFEFLRNNNKKRVKGYPFVYLADY
jgi:hypothetical protein